jgi:hypothetical protein
MAKDAYYFSHDSNARNDEKILSLRMELGMEGYGIYWAIIEMLRDSTDYRMRTQCERIAFELHADSEHIKSVMNDFELFESDGEYFWSESLLRRMEIKEERSKKASLSAKARWDKAKTMRTHSEGNANAMQGKESKGKESKVQERDITVLNAFKENVLNEAKELNLDKSIYIPFLEHWTERDFESKCYAWQVPETFIIKSRLKGWKKNNDKDLPKKTKNLFL